MKIWPILLLFVALFIFGCDGWDHGGNNTTACPATCTFGCMPDNVTCRSVPDPCINLTCTDKCEDTSVLNTKGECDHETGLCTYKKMVCVFGCVNDSCRPEPLCPQNCPFGCEPGTDVCISPTCPSDCTYGCIPGTLQCNSIPPSSGIKNGDFEEGYMGWNVSGIAFGSAPTSAAFINAHQLYRNVPYSGYSGAYFASSYFPRMDKRAMGNLTSEQFFINKDYLEFLVVGDYSAQVYVELVVNKTVVKHVEPDNSYSPFQKITWNVSKYRGQSANINVVDASTTASIDVDNFMLLDSPSLSPGEPYVDFYGNFSIVPPRNWLVVHPSVQGEVFIYGSKDDNITSQLTVISEKVTQNETAETYLEKGKGGLNILLQNYSEISESNITIGGLDAKQLDYVYISGGIAVEGREVFLLHNGLCYKISGTAAESAFSKYVNDFNNSINSFRVPYTNNRYKFSLVYPPDWQASEGLMGATVAFTGTKDGNFTPICYVGEEQLGSNYTLMDYVNKSKASMASLLSNYTPISERSRVINGENAYELVSTYMSNMTGGNKLKLQQAVVLIKNGIGHTITCTITPELFDKHHPEFESLITSFRFAR
jgi:hypothetical protein